MVPSVARSARFLPHPGRCWRAEGAAADWAFRENPLEKY